MKFKDFSQSIIGSTICNLLLAYVFFMLARLIFFFVNYSYFGDYMTGTLAWDMLRGSLVFDTTGILYVNATYIILSLLPFHPKENRSYYRFTRIVYLVLNSL